MVRLTPVILGISLSAAALVLPSVVSAADDYVVAEGDTLAGIAAEAGVPLRDLLAANGLTVNSLIIPGQHLVVPDVAEVAPTPGPAYTVAPGDTLGGIASRAGVSLQALLAVNSMSVNSLITPGMEIRLPAGATAPSQSGTGRASTGTAVDRAINFALAQVGKPYTFFTKGPAEFDCSGLTLQAYAQVGVTLVHHAATQATQGTDVDFWSQSIQAGDLVFLDGDWDGNIDHVGMALGSGMWVQASKTHDVVMTGPLPPRSVIISVRRYLD
jgi:cell wall-associated NlpC family hydrolase